MWTIDSKGAVKGKIGGLEFVGTVDSKGSLEATASYQGKKWVIRGKLAPRKLYSSFELLQQENQTFSAIAEDGERLVFAVKVSL
jgi:threonine dehydrogenase-like Zn-dependent dehydrogenase